MKSLALGSLIVFTLLAGGCQQVGPKGTYTRTAATVETPSPNTLNIQDNDKIGTANGVGPARYTSVTEGEIQTMSSGVTPRDLWYRKLADGTVQFNLSSGTDIEAEGVEIDPASGTFKVAKFGTSASKPLEALGQANAALAAYWTALSTDQRAARIAELEAASKAGDTFAPVILTLIKAAAGVP